MTYLIAAINLRELGSTYREISEKLGCTIDWCKKKLKNVPIPIIINKNKKCDMTSLLENSRESFYWLGFLMADGHFSDKNRLQIMISIKDELHLDKLKTFLKVEIKTYKSVLDKVYVGISAMDTKVIREIKSRFSIVSSKTLTPCNISSLTEEELFCLSIGFIDGDGCIDKQYNRVHPKLRVKCHPSWLPNLKLLYPLGRSYLDSRGYANVSISETELLVNMKLRAEYLKLPIMTRKWDMIDVTFKSNQQRTKENLPIIMEMFNLGYPQKYISELLGYHNSSISTMIKKGLANE